MTKALPTTDEAPRLARGKKWLLVRYATRSLCVLAAMLAARITLDILQLRGELVDYGVNRGKLMYPSDSFAYHNTLLLGSQTDSLTLNLELGEFTTAVEVFAVHALQPDPEVQLLNRCLGTPFFKAPPKACVNGWSPTDMYIHRIQYVYI